MRLPTAVRARWVVVALVVLAFGAFAIVRSLGRNAVAARIRQTAGERGFTATWQSLALEGIGRVRLGGVVLTRTPADTVFRAERLVVSMDLGSLATLRPDVSAIELAHARIRWKAPAVADTLALVDPEAPPPPSARLEKARRAAENLARLLLAPARRLPRLALRDVVIEGPPDDEAIARGVRLTSLDLDPARDGVRLALRGVLALERDVPFEGRLAYGHDDRLTADATLALLDTTAHTADTLRIAVDGRLHQDRRAGVLRLADDSRVTFGRLPMVLGGAFDRHGPRVRVTLAADDLTQPRIEASVPPAVLGPLRELAVNGSFDYRLRFDLDLARPDSVDFAADVIPHDLRLDPSRTHLPLFNLDGPFIAAIHLPRDRVVHRDLSPGQPSFRPLGAIDSTLVRAVVTNEDGGFYRHRGFNVDAMKEATAENLKAGAFRRGAGTITMQLARNLFLGHRRTLSRKGQEIVLAWVLEHLTGLPKHRLLEIYLNVIEWGPGIHGATEAAQFYFGKDPGALTVDEALFLTILVPSPSRWRGRLDAGGGLRRYARAQMHFIGRAMVRKGWLDPARLAPADSFRIELRGPAGEAFRPDSARADTAFVS